MNSPQARRERWANGGGDQVSGNRPERAPLVLSGPVFQESVLNLNPSESGMLVVTMPDEARTGTAASGGAVSAGAATAPPVVSFDRSRGQWIATYADGTVLGHDGNEWSSDALISGTVTVRGTRYSASESRYYDEHIRWGGSSEMAGRIIERQRARDRAIANPANFSRDMHLAMQAGISMDQLLAARASALPRELRGPATMYDAPGSASGLAERVWSGIGETTSNLVDAAHSPFDAMVGLGKAIPNAFTGTVEFLAKGFAAQGVMDTSNSMGLSLQDTMQLLSDTNATVSTFFDPFTLEYSSFAQAAGIFAADAASMLVGGVGLTRRFGQVGGLLRPRAPVGDFLAYDISTWADYGLPSDGVFVRTLTREPYLDLKAGREINFAGRPNEDFPQGMGFIGSAEEVQGLTTRQAYREGRQAAYDPKYVLEFQLRDPAGLQNAIMAPYAEFVPGGRTGAGFKEWNYPGIGSKDIVNPRVRMLQ